VSNSSDSCGKRKTQRDDTEKCPTASNHKGPGAYYFHQAIKRNMVRRGCVVVSTLDSLSEVQRVGG